MLTLHVQIKLSIPCMGAGGAFPEMTCGFLIQLVFCKICRYVYVFSAVHIMLLPSQKPSSSYSLLKFGSGTVFEDIFRLGFYS